MQKILLAMFLVLPLSVSAQAKAAAPDAAPTVATAGNVTPAPIVTQPVAPAPATQNPIQTSGPVTSTTSIDVGTYAGQALMWVLATFGTTIGAALTALIVKLLQKAGIDASDALRQKLQDMIVNGLNAGAAKEAAALQGKGQVEIKNAVVASTVQYVQAHGADTLKQLGIDPNSNIAIEAIKARIETAINDPATPTPPVLDPVAAPKAA